MRCGGHAKLEQIIIGLRRERQIAAQASKQIFAASAAVVVFGPRGTAGKRKEDGNRDQPPHAVIALASATRLPVRTWSIRRGGALLPR